MRHNIKILFLILLSFGILFSGTTGKLTGVISDSETGEPLIGCNVIVEGSYLGATTDENGHFFILNIPPGWHTIRFEYIGYESQVQEGVLISMDKTTRLNGQLAATLIEGTEVVVTAERKLIQFDVTQSEAIVTADAIEAMPVTEVSDVLRLQGGVTQDSEGGLHIRGGRTSEVAYMVDGVPMSDGYDGGVSVQIENDNIQELQVISGTFNAEYGKALTGVINMVTKDGSNDFEASLNMYSGDYITSDVNYANLESFSPLDDYSVSAQLSGPILKDRLFFYSSGRTNVTDGWLYGLSTFTIYGDTLFQDTNGNRYRDSGEPLNNPVYQSLNGSSSWSIQNKLTLRAGLKTIIKFNTIFNSKEATHYNHAMQLVKDGQPNSLNQGRLLGLNLSHSFSSKSFFQINVSEYSYSYQSYLFEDPNDPRYITPDSLYWAHIQGIVPEWAIEEYGERTSYFPGYAFSRWGVDVNRFQRETRTRSLKLDYSNQINQYNLIKLGVDASIHELTLDQFSLLDSVETDRVYTPIIPEKDSFVRSSYKFTPHEFAIYLQDKIEYGDMIINAGVRYEYFNPRAQVPNNIHEPYINDPRYPALDTLSLEELENIDWGAIAYTEQDTAGNGTSHTYAEHYERFNDQPDLASRKGWWREVNAKSQFSPRLAVAYPISDKGVIHFAYGYFFKVPEFSYLYNNTEYKLSETGTFFGIFGNPDLEPETTVSYELGLRQEVTSDIRFELRGFYRDARNYVSSGIPIDLGDGKSYFTYVNKDYSNSRGLIVTIFKRYNQGFGGQVDYTYQVAEGANSNPREEFGAVLAGDEPARSIIPLDWDQTHNLNGSIYTKVMGWGVNTIFQFGSGYPYTPVITNYERQGEVLSNVLVRNSRRKPTTYRIDLKIDRELTFFGINGKLYISVFNVTDRRNQLSVYGDSGQADVTENERRANAIAPFEPLRPNTIEAFYHRPDWYDEPRKIQLGIQTSW